MVTGKENSNWKNNIVTGKEHSKRKNNIATGKEHSIIGKIT